MLRIVFVAALVFVSLNAMINPAFPLLQQQQLQPDDRVIFLGDSITQAGVGPDGYVTLFRKMVEKQRPGLNIEVVGAGISGNKVTDLKQRLQRDVLDKKPNVVVIYIGINDVWHTQNGNGTPIPEFESGLVDIIGQIKQSGARVLLCTPSVIGELHDGGNELDSMLEQYSAVSRNVAEQTESSLLDLRKAFILYLRENNKQNQPKNILTSDGVHLNSTGNRFVAEQMFAGLGLRKAGRKPESGPLLRHVVLFNFNDDLPAGQIDEIVAAFDRLPEQVDSIVGYERGTDISPENLSRGFTHCFIVSFADAAGRDAYLPHPAHKQFVELISGKIEEVLVVDFWSDGSGKQQEAP